MNPNFFKAKRSWSRYKDLILTYYLDPYIAKVDKLRKPILIVDCFAGCGQFEDGEPGSPLIICEAIKRWREKGVAVSGEFIESDRGSFVTLEQVLTQYKDFASSRHAMFESVIGELAVRAQSHTVFLYVDPYTVSSLDFARMKLVYDQIEKSSASVEVLLNFNVATFMRWALAALKRFERLPDDATNEDADYQADNPDERVEIATLNSIAGGEYWQAIAQNASISFVEKLEKFSEAYSERLGDSFKFVCNYPVKEKFEHQTPKYMLLFGTRSIDGIALMNDGMYKARKMFLGKEFQSGTLFDLTPPQELPDDNELRNYPEMLNLFFPS